ncbi:MAG: hypothetical protein ABW005_13195 [Burkholderiaceae bacterium]
MSVRTSPPGAAEATLSFIGVFLLVFFFYRALLSGLPVDDMPRYVDELGANRFFWDLGHVWMQPLALLIHRALGGWLSIVETLEGINVASVAAGAAVFFATLRRLGHGVPRALAAVALLVVSFNLLSLGPTGHIKLMVFPCLALALHHAVLWEHRLGSSGYASNGQGIAAGFWLGVGANLLVSILPMAVFVALFMLRRLHQAGRPLRAAVRGALPFCIAAFASGALLLLLAYLTARASATTTEGLAGFVLHGLRDKQNLHVGFVGWRETPFRFAFSLVYNFVFLPNLGGLGRAALWGYVQDWSLSAGVLAREASLLLLSLGVLLSITVAGLRRLRQPADALLLPFGFILGAAAFSLYYNLNDPEHWFQFTLPLIFVAVQVRRRWLDALVLGLWLPLLAINNLALYGLPKARFDVPAHELALHDALGERGLYIGFAAYPGEPDSSLLNLNGIERLQLDLALLNEHHGKVDALLAATAARIDATLDRGGQVLVFRALDPADWRGPAMQMKLAGLGEAEFRAALARRYQLSGPVLVAGFPAWRVSRSP